MIIKTEEELNNLRIAGKIVGDTHNYLKQFINVKHLYFLNNQNHQFHLMRLIFLKVLP